MNTVNIVMMMMIEQCKSDKKKWAVKDLLEYLSFIYISVGEEAAQVYYNFDQKDPIDLRSTNNKKIASSAFVYTVQVPERKSPVLYITARQYHYIGTSYSECIT